VLCVCVKKREGYIKDFCSLWSLCGILEGFSKVRRVLLATAASLFLLISLNGYWLLSSMQNIASHKELQIGSEEKTRH